MKYCEDMCQTMSGTSLLLKLMGEPWEAIMQEKQLRKLICAQVNGGQHYTRIPRHTIRHAVHVKELKNHREEMSYHYILKYLCSALRSGKFILLGQFIPLERKRLCDIFSL